LAKTKVKQSASNLAPAVKQLVERIGKEEYSRLRRQCQTDLWFLCKEIFKLDLVESTHRPLIDFFIKKTPFDTSKPYTLSDLHTAIKNLSTQRKGVLLYPRGTYKSSVDAIDIVQYIICFPDIRILCLVGESSLGEAFVPQIKRHFVLEPNGQPTLFQMLFPEFVIDLATMVDKGGEQEYWCPARKLTNQKESTLGSISILGSTSGWHCDVLKSDDCVTDTNAQSEAQREKIKVKFITVMNLLDAHGVLEIIGTRYHPEDLYQHCLDTLTNPRVQVAASWIVLPHAAHKKLLDLLPGDVVLLFPEKQDFEHLREKLKLDEETFRNQQLNAPSKSGPTVTFKIDDLRRATIPPSQFPEKVRRFNFWDLAYGGDNENDFCVGAFVTVDDKHRVFVQNLVVDKFSPEELIFQIVKLAKESKPELVLMEDMVGASWLEAELRRQAVANSINLPLKLMKMDRSKDAKANRIRGLETLLRTARLFFSNLIPNMDLVYKQFTDFTGARNRKKHDDIPDAISFVRHFLPVAGLESAPSQQKQQLSPSQKDYNFVFGNRQNMPTPTPLSQAEQRQSNPYFPDVLAA
jgi:phage terminase large subunit-like protein